jgi:hypothetical protein
MADVGELLIRIAFEVDPEGAKKATSELQGLSKEMKATGEGTKRATSSMRSFREEVRSSSRVLSIGGFALSNMAMTLQATGAISQDTAKSFAVAGSAMIGVGHAMQLASSAVGMLKNGLSSVNSAIIIGAAAVASYTITWNYLDSEWQKSSGHFTNLKTALQAPDFKTMATQVLKFTQVTAAENQALQAATEEMIKQEPRLKTWYELTLNIADATTALSKREDDLMRVGKKLATLSSDYNEWKQAINTITDAQEAQEDGARSLRRAQLDLNDLLAEGADVEKKWTLAQNMYKTGALSAKGLEKARSEHEKYVLSLEDAKDAIDDQNKANEDNNTTLTDAQKVKDEMEKKYPGMGYADLKPLIEEATVTQEAMTTEIEQSRDALRDMRDSETALAKELGPELTTTFTALKNPTGEVRDALLAIQGAQAKTVEDAQKLYDIYTAMGKLPFIGAGIGGWMQSYLEAGGVNVPGVTAGATPGGGGGNPYVSKDGLMRVHTGEAIIPANQNNYADNISIKNLSLSRGYGMDTFMKDRDRAIRIKRKMLGYS